MLTLFRRNLSNIQKRRYLETVKLFPGIRHENAQRFTTLALTLAALSFFGIFAINPTLTTITRLHKELDDSKFVDEQLATKIANLSMLQQRYSELSADLPRIYNAVPENPEASVLLGQMQTLAQNSSLQIVDMQVNKVELASAKKDPKKDASFTFSFEATGNSASVTSFIQSLTGFDRIITLESITMERDPENPSGMLVTILARAYYKQAP